MLRYLLSTFSVLNFKSWGLSFHLLGIKLILKEINNWLSDLKCFMVMHLWLSRAVSLRTKRIIVLVTILAMYCLMIIKNVKKIRVLIRAWVVIVVNHLIIWKLVLLLF